MLKRYAKTFLNLLYRIDKEQLGEGGPTIAVLIVIMIMIIVGINLIVPMSKTVKEITDATVITTTTSVVQGTTITGTTSTPAYSKGISSLVEVLPIVFVAFIILGAVACLGGDGFGFSFGSSSGEKKSKKEVTVTVRLNSQHTISLVEKASNSLEPYINNLEELLGIRTINMNQSDFYRPTAPLEIHERDNEQWLFINERDYDWYITAKQQDDNVFKVVGLNKTDSTNNVVYVLGKHINPINADSADFFCIKVQQNRTANEIVAPDHMTKV